MHDSYGSIQGDGIGKARKLMGIHDRDYEKRNLSDDTHPYE